MHTYNLGGIGLQSPFIVGSGPLSYGAAGMERLHLAGAGAVTTKTIRLIDCINPKPHMFLNSRDSLVNCEKWTDLSADQWIKTEIPRAVRGGVVVIASIGHTLPESSRLAEPVAASGAAMIELVSYDEADLIPMVTDIRRRVKCPVLVKLSPNGKRFLETAQRCVAAGADAITACDSLGPVLRIDIRTGRPALAGANGTGWLSGRAIKPIILQRVAELRNSLTCPIIGLGGVMEAADAIEMAMAGATFVGLCTALILRGPEYLSKLRSDTEKMLDELGYANFASVSGVALQYLRQPEQTSPLKFAYVASKCIHCGQCVKTCCYQARSLSTDGTMDVDIEKCHYCGLCVDVCPTRALTFCKEDPEHV